MVHAKRVVELLHNISIVREEHEIKIDEIGKQIGYLIGEGRPHH